MTNAAGIKIGHYGAAFGKIVQQQKTALPAPREGKYLGGSAKEGRLGLREADQQQTAFVRQGRVVVLRAVMGNWHVRSSAISG